MSTPETREVLSFTAKRELTDIEMFRLARLLGALGMEPQFEPKSPRARTKMGNILARETVLANHIANTYPLSALSYIGKEHFWAIGEEVGIERRDTGILFSEICFPCTGNPRTPRWKGSNKVKKIDREALGLNVKARTEARVPYPPIPIGTTYPSAGVRAHFDRRSREAETAVQDSVIQIKGVLDIENVFSQIENIHFTPKSKSILPRFIARLSELPAR